MEEEPKNFEDEPKDEEPKDEEPDFPKINWDFLKKTHTWQIATAVLVILFIVSLFNPFSSGVSGSTVKDTVEELSGAEVLSIDIESGLYKVEVKDEDGNEGIIWMSKDGELLFSGAINVNALREYMEGAESITGSAVQEQQAPKEYSEEDLEKIKEFITCLEEKGLKIYGANWCGWTKKLVVETLGGFDIAAPIYIECTEDRETCGREGIKGFPTVKINGQPYQGPRTFEGFAEITGCTAPDVEMQVSNTQEASCQ